MWHAAIASARGSSHSVSGEECQDSCALAYSPSGEWIALCVSDGAGTAVRAQEGSELTATQFSQALVGLSDQLEDKSPGEWLIDAVISIVLDIRSELRKRSPEKISDLNCTLVACLLGPSGGLLIHIGDGIATAGKFVGHQDGNLVNPWEKVVISEPKNGEYSNETFFITGSDWLLNLRIKPLDRADWVCLGSDGGASLAFSGLQPKAKFLGPLFTRLAHESDFGARCDLLYDTLADTRADAVTDDDRTLAIAFSSDVISKHHIVEFPSNTSSPDVLSNNRFSVTPPVPSPFTPVSKTPALSQKKPIPPIWMVASPCDPEEVKPTRKISIRFLRDWRILMLVSAIIVTVSAVFVVHYLQPEWWPLKSLAYSTPKVIQNDRFKQTIEPLSVPINESAEPDKQKP